MTSQSERLAGWATSLAFEDIPDDVIDDTKRRLIDVIGLAGAGLETDFGASVCNAAEDGGRGAHVIGLGRELACADAALVNGALSQALEYDDTHKESIVHMSGPSVCAALALAERHGLAGREVLSAVAVGNEISCRIGVVAPRQFHKRGFHPTGLFAGFGVSYLAAHAMHLDAGQAANAAGIAGSFAAGLLECWVDGTQSKYLHPGWAAHSGIHAARLAGAGATGPREVFEGRFGLFHSHLGDDAASCDYQRASEGLGSHWESRGASLKPFPAAHVIHPYIDAILRLRERHGIDPAAVARIDVPVAGYIVPIVCEPLDEKLRPASASHARVSMQYTLAEALFAGRLGKDSYGDALRTDPAVLALAEKVICTVDERYPGPEQFKGEVRIRMTSGDVFETVEEHNRGSRENPMSDNEIERKFRENLGNILSAERQDRILDLVHGLERMESIGELMSLTASDTGFRLPG